MDTKHWLDYVTAIGAVATPLLVLLLTAVGWRLRQSIERRRELENKLHADRIETYNKILVWCLKSKHQIMVLAARATDAKMVSVLLCHTNGL